MKDVILNFKNLERKEYTEEQKHDISIQFTRIQSAFRDLIFAGNENIIDEEAIDEMLVALKTLKKLK